MCWHSRLTGVKRTARFERVGLFHAFHLAHRNPRPLYPLILAIGLTCWRLAGSRLLGKRSLLIPSWV
jgi:hypothetical protein